MRINDADDDVDYTYQSRGTDVIGDISLGLYASKYLTVIVQKAAVAAVCHNLGLGGPTFQA